MAVASFSTRASARMTSTAARGIRPSAAIASHARSSTRSQVSYLCRGVQSARIAGRLYRSIIGHPESDPHFAQPPIELLGVGALGHDERDVDAGLDRKSVV